jgi:hypothetical protein
MIQRTGRIIDQLPAIQDRLRRALGIGTGTRDSGPAVGSLRGSVVEFASHVVEELDATHGLLLSEPRYSLQRRFQLYLPLLDPDEYETDPFDVILTSGDWTSPVSQLPPQTLAALRLVQTVFHPRHIVRILPVTATGGAMEEIDRKLIALFDL